jgi:hypothetical protein
VRPEHAERLASLAIRAALSRPTSTMKTTTSGSVSPSSSPTIGSCHSTAATSPGGTAAASTSCGTAFA